jgi:hypothetical protein
VLAGLDLSGTTHTNAASYPTDPWSFTDVSGNYNNQNSTVADNIDKADANCSVTGYNVTYNGAAHTATGQCTGVGGPSDVLAGLDLSGTTHTNASSYPSDPWSFTDVTGNYNNQNSTVADNIDKADANCSISGYSGTYDAAAHGATGSCTGVDAGGAAAGSSLNLGAAFTNVPGGTATWTFTGGTNYNDQSNSVAIVINKADAVCNISGYNGIYDFAAHGASGACTGVDAGGAAAGSSLNLGASFTNVPGGTAHWTFTGGINYLDESGDANIVITTAFCFNGFLSPIGGSVETGNGGSWLDPARSFKLGSTIPVKFAINSWNGTTCGYPVLTGFHTLQALFYSTATDSEAPIDATPTDAATTGNQFRLTDNQWHFNLNTKGGFKAGTWVLKATLQDGSIHTVWITIKK